MLFLNPFLFLLLGTPISLSYQIWLCFTDCALKVRRGHLAIITLGFLQMHEKKTFSVVSSTFRSTNLPKKMPSVIIPNTTRNEDYITSRNISGKLKIVNPAVLFRAFVKCYQEYLQTKTSHDSENRFTNTRITFVVFMGLDTQFL